MDLFERPTRAPKRPRGWSKPYWAQAGLCVCVTLLAFVVSLILVSFVCGVVLRAAIPAPPVVWRAIETALDAVIYAAVAWYFATREGYTKRTAHTKVTLVGGLWFALLRAPVALLFGGAPYAAGALARTLAHLVYFGNQSLFVSSIDGAPPLLTAACALVADLCVLIPVTVVAERVGAKAFKDEEAALILQQAEETAKAEE